MLNFFRRNRAKFSRVVVLGLDGMPHSPVATFDCRRGYAQFSAADRSWVSDVYDVGAGLRYRQLLGHRLRRVATRASTGFLDLLTVSPKRMRCLFHLRERCEAGRGLICLAIWGSGFFLWVCQLLFRLAKSMVS